MQLVDEEDDLALRSLDLLQHGLQAILELSPVLRSRDERAHVERAEPLVLQGLGHVAAGYALRNALDDRRLADARLADEHGVVLGPAREHLHDAPDLLIATDDGINLALARHVSLVATILVERLELDLGILIGHALRPAHALQCLDEVAVRHTRDLQNRDDLRVLQRHRQYEMLDGHVLVLELLALGLRHRHQLAHPAREVRGRRPASHLRVGLQRFGELAP